MKHSDYLDKKKQDSEFTELYKVEKLKAEISVAIAKTRQTLGLSQVMVAEKAHLTQQQFSKVEQANNCNIETYFKAMVALNMDFKDVLPEGAC